jgi:hypothetical protein
MIDVENELYFKSLWWISMALESGYLSMMNLHLFMDTLYLNEPSKSSLKINNKKFIKFLCGKKIHDVIYGQCLGFLISIKHFCYQSYFKYNFSEGENNHKKYKL